MIQTLGEMDLCSNKETNKETSFTCTLKRILFD